MPRISLGHSPPRTLAFLCSSLQMEPDFPRGAYAFHFQPTFSQKALTCNWFAKLCELVRTGGGRVNPKKLFPWHFLKTTSLVFCLYTLELESTLSPCSCKTLWFHQQGDKRLYNLFASFRHVNTSIKQAHNSQATRSWAALAPSTVKT